MSESRQLPLFANDRRCKGGSCSELLPDGRWKCLHCGRIIGNVRDGFRNCGLSDRVYWDLLNEQYPNWPEMDETPDVIVPRK